MPNVVILAGPNGAGKSTVSRSLLSAGLGVPHFVNADVLANGLSAFRSEEMAIKAGRIVIVHLNDLAKEQQTFAFETTLASKMYAAKIRHWKQLGYRFHLFFIWLPTVETAIQRVRERVATGGHHIPEDVIRRRYQRGIDNFHSLYQALADEWKVMENLAFGDPRLIAKGNDKMVEVHAPDSWAVFQSQKGSHVEKE